MTSGGPDGTSRQGAVLIRGLPLFPDLDRRGRHGSVAFKGFELPLPGISVVTCLSAELIDMIKQSCEANHLHSYVRMLGFVRQRDHR